MTQPGPRAPDAPRARRATDLAIRSLSVARLFVIAGVISSVVLAIVLYFTTMLRAGFGIWEAAKTDRDHDPTKTLLLMAVEQADVLLVATALLIIGFGLYSLFIGRPHNLPGWLQIESIDELKAKLIGVVIAALGVNFFSAALSHKPATDLLAEGLATAVVVVALSYFLQSTRH